jgi:hypothetical protein
MDNLKIEAFQIVGIPCKGISTEQRDRTLNLMKSKGYTHVTGTILPIEPGKNTATFDVQDEVFNSYKEL